MKAFLCVVTEDMRTEQPGQTVARPCLQRIQGKREFGGS